jgi:hypothetical protein
MTAAANAADSKIFPRIANTPLRTLAKPARGGMAANRDLNRRRAAAHQRACNRVKFSQIFREGCVLRATTANEIVRAGSPSYRRGVTG